MIYLHIIYLGMSEKIKIINDPIHGMIRLCDTAVRIIDTPIFQRLRKLKQLGLCDLVFPGAEHTRFAHSIGTYHLARRQMQALQTKHPNMITDKEVLMVSVAGLCHDLGHGPLSHTFEDWLHGKGVDFHHESMSCILLQEIVKSDKVLRARFTDEEIACMQNMIHKSDTYVIPDTHRYLYELVCNNWTSIDVDKFDYILRDCYYTGKPYKIDVNIFIESCKVVNGRLCYDSKIMHDVYNLFLCRYNLFREVYYHKVLVGINEIVYEMFDGLNEVYNIVRDIKTIMEGNWWSYLKYTDELITGVKLLDTFSERSSAASHPSERVGLKRVTGLYDRITRRDIYKCVVNMTSAHMCEILGVDSLEGITEALLKDVVAEETGLDVIVRIHKLNFAMHDKNPVENVPFYNKYDNIVATYPAKYVSVMLPHIYEESLIRIYLRKYDGESVDKLLQCFKSKLSKYE